MKKLFLTAIVIMIIAATALTFAACTPAEDATAAAISYIRVKINPEVELTAGEDGTVTSFTAVNEDAEVLLSDTDLVGMSTEDAIEEIVDQATEAGYIDTEADNNNVSIGVICQDSKVQTRLKTKLMSRVRQFFRNNGINGNVSEETLDAYAAQAAELGVSTGKMKMILRALEIDPELDIQTLKDMPVKDIIALLKDRANQGIGCTLQNEFREQNAALREKYSHMFELQASIEALQAQIAAYEGDEAGRAELQNQLAALQNEIEPLRAAYQAELQSLNQEQQQERTQLREQRRQEKQSRVAAQTQKRNAGKGNGGK